MDSTTVLDKAYGTLIGSALGDTIGLYTEFMSTTQAKEYYPTEEFSLVDPVTPFHADYHRSRFELRAWTDDTDHTLLLILSFLRNGELSELDFADRLKTWCQQGLRCLDRLPMGLGKTVGNVVFSPTFLSDPLGASISHWEKSQRSVAPNGSVMRTSPIGIICLNQSENETFAQAIRMGRLTHADPRCSVSVAITAGLVRSLCRGEIHSVKEMDELIERAWMYMQNNPPSIPPLSNTDSESSSPTSPPPALDREEFEKHMYSLTLEALVLANRTMGYVYKCIGSALWCLRQVLDGKETFKSAMVKLTMAAGDADTNGAVAGALMGAYVGYDGLPEEWKGGMMHEQWYREKIKALCLVAKLIEGSGQEYEYDAQADRDTALDGGRGFLSEEEMKKREVEILEKILLAEKARREERDEKLSKQKQQQQQGTMKEVINKFKFW